MQNVVGLLTPNSCLSRYEIVEGDHELWDSVSGPYRETICAFLVHFQSQVGPVLEVAHDLAC